MVVISDRCPGDAAGGKEHRFELGSLRSGLERWNSGMLIVFLTGQALHYSTQKRKKRVLKLDFSLVCSSRPHGRLGFSEAARKR